MIVKVAVVAPLATVTLAATAAAPGLLLESDTSAPPLGACPLNVTVPVDGVPPVTLAGFTLTDERVGNGTTGRTVSVAVRVTPFSVAEMVTEVCVSTGLVLTVKFAVVAPARTVTLAGTVATLVLLLESATTIPPVGADPLKVTVPVEDVPPIGFAGLRPSAVSVGAGGVTVSEAVRVVPPSVAEMVTEVDAVTELVLTVKVAVVAPAGTVTLAGTVAMLVLLLESDTTVPPLGADALSVTVPVEELPPVTLVGLRPSEVSVGPAGGVTVSEAVRVVPLSVAEMVTEVDAVTELVLTVKVALVAPPATVTLAGTVATLVLLLESDTTVPPVGAGPLSVTVPVEELPPVTLVGLRPSDVSVGPAGAGVTVSEAVAVAPKVAESVTVVEAATVLVVTVNVAVVAPL